MMKFPNFWLQAQKRQIFFILILSPFSFIWALATKIKFLMGKNQKLPIPVICVGNVTVGGNGKTPTALKLQNLLTKMGYKAHIISRGYKANLKGPHFVNKDSDSSFLVGDEPLMISQYGPNWISKNRISGIKLAAKHGAEVAILDDGFQNNSFRKDFSILVIDCVIGFGNGWLIPSGPLRESPHSALNRADAIITLGTKLERNKFLKTFPICLEKIHFQGSVEAIKNDRRWNKVKVYAFTGIGRPKKFFGKLAEEGAVLVKTKSFSNHSHFNSNIIEAFVSEAKKSNAIVITTEKDYVKLPKKLKAKIYVYRINIKIEKQAELLKLIKESINQASN